MRQHWHKWFAWYPWAFGNKIYFWCWVEYKVERFTKNRSSGEIMSQFTTVRNNPFVREELL